VTPSSTLFRRSVARRTLLLVAFGVLGGCASLRDGTADPWHAGLPPIGFFEQAYARDGELQDEQSLQEYLYWVRKFYAGTTLYPRGWNDISRDLLAAADDDTNTAQRERKLYLLGRDIAAEWSKANSVRDVDDGHLAVWSIAAGRAVNEDNVDKTLDAIMADLQQLLAGALSPDAITANRYHEPDPEDWFAF